MSIPTQMSLTGFIVSISELQTTKVGADYVRLRIGTERRRHEADGTFTPLAPSYHDMVAFEVTARRAAEAFRPGDHFIASGYIHEYEVDRPGGSVIKEDFVARRIGHNATRTRYEVQRTIRAVPETAPVTHSPVVGL